MQTLLRQIDVRDARQWVLFWVVFGQVGLIWAPAFLSISMAGILVTGLVTWARGGWHPRQHPLAVRRSLLVLTLLFWLVLPGAIGLDDTAYWLSRLRIKVPLLVVPVSFLLLPPLTRRQWWVLHAALLVLLFGVSLQITTTYLQDFAAINELVKQGQPLPTPGNHIRLSLLLAYGVVSGVLLFRSLSAKRSSPGRWLAGVATGSLFVFMHILSVRSGLAVLYGALLVLLVYEVLQRGRWKLAVAGLVLLVSVPVLAYQLVPSFRNKINYAKYELWMQRQGQAHDQLSDAGRLLSWRIGYDIWRAHPWLGVGPGDLKQEVMAVYAEDYPEVTRKRMPHNQFLSVAAGSGVAGLLVFLFALGFPLLTGGCWRDPHLGAFYVIILASCLVENTLENAEGVGLFVWWVTLHVTTEAQGH
jgi:O-antigen ligase